MKTANVMCVGGFMFSNINLSQFKVFPASKGPFDVHMPMLSFSKQIL